MEKKQSVCEDGPKPLIIIRLKEMSTSSWPGSRCAVNIWTMAEESSHTTWRFSSWEFSHLIYRTAFAQNYDLSRTHTWASVVQQEKEHRQTLLGERIFVSIWARTQRHQECHRLPSIFNCWTLTCMSSSVPQRQRSSVICAPVDCCFCHPSWVSFRSLNEFCIFTETQHRHQPLLAQVEVVLQNLQRGPWPESEIRLCQLHHSGLCQLL